ncbi:transposase [Apiospora marii]|uniref:Transposase n=1 Tax=Apiospora marii TaxID=335849 RepID=A0ABR1RJY4_9PEZI
MPTLTWANSSIDTSYLGDRDDGWTRDDIEHYPKDPGLISYPLYATDQQFVRCIQDEVTPSVTPSSWDGTSFTGNQHLKAQNQHTSPDRYTALTNDLCTRPVGDEFKSVYPELPLPDEVDPYPSLNPSAISEGPKGFNEEEYQLAVAQRMIAALGAEVEARRARKRRRIQMSPNAKFANIEAVRRAQIEVDEVEGSTNESSEPKTIVTAKPLS